MQFLPCLPTHAAVPDRGFREEDAAIGSVASGGSGNKRKRIGQKGVDAILELGPRDRGAESAEEEDTDDPFGEAEGHVA